MRVSFELTRDDYAALTFHKASPPRMTRQRLLVLALLLGVMVGLMGLLTLLHGGLAWVDEAPLLRPLLWAIGIAVGAFVAISALLWALRLWVRRLPRDDGATLGEHTLEVDEDGFHVEGRSGRAFVKWSAIVEVRETNEHLFLFVDRMLAYVVPKRAFTSADECAAFADYVRARTLRS